MDTSHYVYTLVASRDLTEFSELVTNKLCKGWVLVGSPIVDSGDCLCQAMLWIPPIKVDVT